MKAQQSLIPLGFEVPTGEPVEIPLTHMAVTGMTQASGKTTTLEALVSRSDMRAIAFVTKRGETAFAGGNRLQPYFRDRADWQFVDQLLEAQLREKNKFLRPWIMRACRTTRTLADVHTAVKKELVTAKGFNQGIYTQLDAYLELIVPEIAHARLAASIDLRPGLNVMDVSGYSVPMQMLFVQSAIDWVNEKEENVVVIVPEAWQFIPESKGSPVKHSAVTLVRQGAGIGNFIWVDSQDMAGVDKVILRGCTVWLIGVQREANEIKRSLANIPASVKRPSAAKVATLERGQFFACYHNETVKVYVQPVWLDSERAKRVAHGDSLVPLAPDIRHHLHITKPESTVTEQEARELRAENYRLKQELSDLRTQLRITAPSASASRRSAEMPVDGDAEFGRAMQPPRQPSPRAEGNGELSEALYAAIKQRLLSELPSDPVLLKVLTARPELQVHVERKALEIDGDSLRGRIGRLLAEGFFDEPQSPSTAGAELVKRGANPSVKFNVGNELKALAGLGFLTRDNKWYRAVETAKVNIVEANA